MKILIASLAVAVFAEGAAHAAAPDQSSPYDKNPRCTERTVDSNSPECILQTEGEPRQTYPPKEKKPTPPPPDPPVPPSPPKSKPQIPRPGASS